MGIRIHKMLGYGLVDLKIDPNCKYSINDERINPNGILAPEFKTSEYMDAYDRAEGYTADGYIKWLDENFPGDEDFVSSFEKLKIKELKKKDHYFNGEAMHLFDRHGEFGIPEVLCIRPFCMDSWHRFDDTIDWYFESKVSENPQQNWVKVLDDGIYPYSGMLFNKKLGKRVSLDDVQRHRVISGGYIKEEYLAEALAEFGCNSMEEYNQSIKPMVPEEIVRLCKYCEVFTDDKYIQDLVPMMYVYWG